MGDLTLKVGFPPGHPAAHSMIKVPGNATVEDTLKSIIQKQNISHPENYLLYIPPPTPMWMDKKNALMNSFGLKNQGIIELKKKHQLVRVGGKGMSHTLLVDVTRPLSEFMKWVAVKFLIDAEDIPNWSLYYKGQEMNQSHSMTQQSHESQFSFVLVNKTEAIDLASLTSTYSSSSSTSSSSSSIPSSSSSSTSSSSSSSTPSSTSTALPIPTTTATTTTTSAPSSAASSPNPHYLSLDEEEPLPTLSSNINGSKGVEREPHASDEIPARSLTNVAMEGWLKKLTTKKEWKKRYFMLSNKNLYYYKSPQDRKLTNVIPMANYSAKPTNLQAKEAKYWAFELFSNSAPAKSAKSPRKDKGNGLILRCENEQEMHSWLAAIRGDNTPKLAPQPVPDRRSRAKSGYPHAVFGVELAKSVPVGAEIPNIVEQAIKYIDAKALDLVGIYRLSGSAPTIANWKRLFDKGEKVDLNQEPDPHAVAGLLKLFLRELPEPILTFAKYDDFIAAISHTTKWSKVKAIKEVVATLVGVNRTVLLTLVQHLRRVNEKCDINKMHLANLATVFGPTLLRKPSTNATVDGGFDATVFSMVVDTPAINELCMSMIEDYDYIFGNKTIPHSATFARALYAYNGEDQNTELSFEAGSIIRVTQMGQKDAWWMGQILLSPNSDFIGKSGCFPGSCPIYVEPVSGTSADWISLSALYTLTENVEANRGQLVSLQAKLDTLEKAKAQEIINKEAAASKGEKKQQAIAEAVGVNPNLDRLWEHMDDLALLLSMHNKSSTSVEVDNVRQSFLKEVDQLNTAKFKSKSDQAAYVIKFDSLRASLESEKQARNKLSITTNIVLKDIEFLKNMLK